MNNDEYNKLFHKLNLNLVAFKPLMECDQEVLKLVNAAIEAQREDEREKVVQWMIQRSYATGHGDTTEDLLAELEWQVREAERNNMVATAAELGWALYGGDPFEDGVRDVAAIRAREQK